MTAMTDEELREAAAEIAQASDGFAMAELTGTAEAIITLARRYAESQRTAARALAGRWRGWAVFGKESIGVSAGDALVTCADELAALFPEVTHG
jgi:hypothetical protein